jgi:hypothetical protein
VPRVLSCLALLAGMVAPEDANLEKP